MPPADREHGHGARGRGRGAADPGLAALARHRLGRPRHLPARPHGALPRRGGRLSRGQGVPRTRARSASACPTRARRPTTTSCSAASRSPTSSSTTSSSCARTGGRPTTSPRPSRTGWTASRTSSAGRTTSRTRRKQIRILEALGAPVPATPTFPTSTGPTGRSCPSATARNRSTSSGAPATCRRRS